MTLNDKPFRVRLEEDEFVDEIRIFTVPRLKTSGLSGDEWRHHIQVEAYRKGLLVGSRNFNRIEWALTRILPWLEDDLLCPIENHKMAEDLCDQPGCKKPWTVLYKMKKRGCGRCGNQRDLKDMFNYTRAFCDEHKMRGDSDLDDMDDIYELAMTRGVDNGTHGAPDTSD